MMSALELPASSYILALGTPAWLAAPKTAAAWAWLDCRIALTWRGNHSSWLRALARPPRNSYSSATTDLSRTNETGPVRALPIVPIFDRGAGCGPFHLHVLAQNMSWLNPQKIRTLRTSSMAFPTQSLTTSCTVSGNLSQSHARPFAHNPTAERDPA